MSRLLSQPFRLAGAISSLLALVVLLLGPVNPARAASTLAVPAAAADSPFSLVDDQSDAGRAMAPADPRLVQETVRRHQPLRSASASSALPTTASAPVRAPLPSFRRTGSPFRSLPVGARPYESDTPVPLKDVGDHDATGVRMYRIGNTLYDQPAMQSQYGMQLLNAYRLTSDSRYLDRARLQAQRLVDRRVVATDTWFFPYPYDFALHGHRSETLRAPWYSAMAQGQAMSLFVRLWQVSGEATWRDAADATLPSLTTIGDPGEPTVVHVASDGFLWMDEYPLNGGGGTQNNGVGPDLTFNGQMFAVFGLYDYAQEFSAAVDVLDGAMTTSRHLLHLIRHAGWLSQYCLVHPSIRSVKYHGIHMTQLLLAHGMTADYGFARYSDAMRDDYPTEVVSGVVRLWPGRHVGYRFSSSGAVTASRTVTLTTRVSNATSARKRILNHSIYYRMTSGSLAGYWVREAYGVASLIGFTGVHEYLVQRTVTVQPGTVTAFRFDSSGTTRSTITRTLRAVSTTRTDRSAWVGGRRYVYIVAGIYAGAWLPLGARVSVR